MSGVLKLRKGMLHTDPNLLSVLVGNPSIKSTLLQGESLLKRLVDVVLSISGIILFSPFLPLVALLIKLDSTGPVFYLADRVGKNRNHFRMWKFRTMIDTPIEVGESVSPQFDPRVTSVGRLLRRSKLNELPQLFNILKGDMTFVGPRPEAPDLAELYPKEAQRVFSVKPGLVGPASIIGRNEEEVYPPGVDVKKYYIENILPAKNKMDLEYIDNPSLLKHIKYILDGVKETFAGAISKRHLHDNRSQIFLLLSDTFLMACFYTGANSIGHMRSPAEIDWATALITLSIVLPTRLAWNIYFGMYSSLIRYLSFSDVTAVIKAVSAGSFTLYIIAHALNTIQYSNLMAFVDSASLIILHSSLRLGLRVFWDRRNRNNDQRAKNRILIYGVCDEGYAACRAFTSDGYFPFEIVGFLDDAPNNFGKTINGKKVLGNRHHIVALARLYRVHEVLIAHPMVHKLSELRRICDRAGLICRIWNPIGDAGSPSRPTMPGMALKLSDLLPERAFRADPAAVAELLTGKTVLMNGSGGALGGELCRRALHLGCGRLIIVDRYESYLNETVAALVKDFSHEKIIPVLADIEETDSLEKVFRNYRPNFVFQAAMRKYSPLLAVDLCDVGQVNYLRTFNLAKAALECGSERFVMISSFTATTRENLIADSLHVAEVSLEHFFEGTKTQFIVARICDVFENRGGIASIVENQIKNREELTLPSADAKACFISKEYGSEFILQSLVDAGKSGTSGSQLFVCDAGSPVLLTKLSGRIASHYGLKLGRDVPIRYTEALAHPPSQPPPSSPSTNRTFRNRSAHAREEAKAFFRDFVENNRGQTHKGDWKEWTQRAIAKCESTLQPWR